MAYDINSLEVVPMGNDPFLSIIQSLNAFNQGKSEKALNDEELKRRRENHELNKKLGEERLMNSKVNRMQQGRDSRLKDAEYKHKNNMDLLKGNTEKNSKIDAISDSIDWDKGSVSRLKGGGKPTLSRQTSSKGNSSIDEDGLTSPDVQRNRFEGQVKMLGSKRDRLLELLENKEGEEMTPKDRDMIKEKIWQIDDKIRNYTEDGSHLGEEYHYDLEKIIGEKRETKSGYDHSPDYREDPDIFARLKGEAKDNPLGEEGVIDEYNYPESPAEQEARTKEEAAKQSISKLSSVRSKNGRWLEENITKPLSNGWESFKGGVSNYLDNVAAEKEQSNAWDLGRTPVYHHMGESLGLFDDPQGQGQYLEEIKRDASDARQKRSKMDPETKESVEVALDNHDDPQNREVIKLILSKGNGKTHPWLSPWEYKFLFDRYGERTQVSFTR